MTKLPTEADITKTANDMAITLGGGVHLQVSDVMLSLDSAFPGMDDDQFSEVRKQVVPIVEGVRSDAIAKMWG